LVFILDDGGYFNAPLDTIWKLLEAHGADGPRIHPDDKHQKMEMAANNVMVAEWENVVEGRVVKIKVRFSLYPPLGTAGEFLEGPFTGSKFFNIYTPKKQRTYVTVAGEWRSPTIPENKLRKAVLSMLQKEFGEDVAYLKTMR
jgi:hypothetical protein